MKLETKKIKWNAVASLKEMLIWAVILVVALIMGARQFFTPLSKKAETARSQVLAKQMELEAYKKFLKSGNTANKKTLEGMDLNKQAMAQKVKDAFTKVNMSSDVVESELLSALTNPAYSKAALLEKFNFVGEKKQAGYSEMNIDLKITGTYNGIGQYLSFIRELPYLIRIDSIAIGNKDGNNNQGQVELSAKAVLYVGEPKAMEQMAQANPRTDMATDLLIEITGGKAAITPFSAQPRDMTNWSVHELKLTSTMAGGARPTALINGKVFSLGDEIADFKIVEVRQREVVLQRGDVQHILKIEEDNSYVSSGQSFLSKTLEPASTQALENTVPNPNNAVQGSGNLNSLSTEEQSGQAIEKKNEASNEASADNASGSTKSGGAAGGEGNIGSPSTGTNPQATNTADSKHYDNPYGVLTPSNEQEPEKKAQAVQEGGGHEDGPSSKKVKLDPNKVENIKFTPRDELEDPPDGVSADSNL